MQTVVLADFFEGLATTDATIQLDSNTSSDTAGGGVSRASYGTRFWHGSVNIARMPHVDADAVSARLQFMQEADVLFRIAPGHLVGVTRTAGTVEEISATDRRIVTLSDQLADGAIFDIEFGSKRTMHRVVNKLRERGSVSVNAAEYTVVPALPYGVAVDDVVGMGRPEIDALVTDASPANYQPVLVGTASFSWAQFY